MIPLDWTGSWCNEQALIILHPKLGQMVNGIVLPIKKVFSLVDSKISVEIKDERRKLQGRLVAVDEYLNIHMDETIESVSYTHLTLPTNREV